MKKHLLRKMNDGFFVCKDSGFIPSDQFTIVNLHTKVMFAPTMEYTQFMQHISSRIYQQVPEKNHTFAISLLKLNSMVNISTEEMDSLLAPIHHGRSHYKINNP